MTFHEDLRNHRLKKGLILEEISEDTKINVRILQALEQGDYHILPVPYIRLFMKAYATAIDYPVEDILRGLENELKLTGEDGISANLTNDAAMSTDMTGAAFNDAQKLLQADKGSQSNVTRLIIVIAILVVIAIFGKSLLKPNSTPVSNTQRQILPALNLSQAIDSLEIPRELLTDGDTLTVTPIDFLSIVMQKGQNTTDTLFKAVGQSYHVVLSDSTQLMLYPGDAALLTVNQDTLLSSPFSNSWLVITADSLGGHSRTYPTL